MKSQLAVLTGVQKIEIHGAPFYDLYFQIEGKAPKMGRLGLESCYCDPKIGDDVRVSLLLGDLVRIERA